MNSNPHVNLILSLPHNAYRYIYAMRHPVKFYNGQRKRFIADKNGNILKPYDDYSCIFIHIPKTGGTAISRSLFHGPSGGHDTIMYYKRIFSKKEFNSYLKFTFVRNPWGRLLSAFNFLKNGGANTRDKQWAKNNIARYDTFEEFVEIGLIKDEVIRWIHFIPQYKFICWPKSNVLLTDFIGRYETLEEDYRRLLSMLKLRDRPLKKLNIGSLGINHDYRQFYTKSMELKISEIYKRDIELFGYTFDGPC